MNTTSSTYIKKSFVYTLIIAAILFAGFTYINQPTVKRLFQIFGGDIINGGYIQILTYFAFVWGLFEVFDNKKYVLFQLSGLQKNLIPEEGNKFFVFYENDVNELNKKMVKFEEENKSKNNPTVLVSEIIKKACVKYINSKQVSEVIDLIAAQVRINQSKTDNRHTMIRFLTWVIPSVGFVGTVIGIGMSLGVASIEPMDRALVTSMLSVAFDTTLVALLLSIVLVYYYHVLQGLEDKLHSETEEYVIDNLVNRIKPD